MNAARLLRRLRFLVPALLLGFALTFGAAQAQTPDRGAERGVRRESNGLGADIKAYITAPLRWRGKDWLKFGGSLAAVGIAYRYDDDVRDHFAPDSVLVNNDTHDLHDAIPAAVALGGTWLYATLIDDDDGRREAAAMFESAAFSSAAAYILKQAAGRQRPDETSDRSSWHAGGDSFPSLHVTAAFAIGTVLAESGNDHYRWLRRVLGYGIAAGTLYERLDHNAHWLSDTVAAAGLGMATARFVMKRRDRTDRRAEVTLIPLDKGLMLSYAVPLRP